VNIHPAKREVKFHREFEVRRYAAQAVRDALLAFHAPAQNLKTTPAAEQVELPPAPAPTTPALPQFPEKLPPATDQVTSDKSDLSGSSSPATPAPLPVAPLAAPIHPQSSILNPPSSTLHPPSTSSAVPLLEVPLRMVGVIGRLYVVLESDRGLVLLDQHAAHERILFEQMMQRLETNTAAPQQKLLLPETIELPPRDAQFLRAQLGALTRLGVGLSEFGERTFLLDALPPFVKVPDARRFVFDLVDELRAAGREVNLARLGEHTVAKTVCRHAVKANDPLNSRELENLVDDLRRCAMPYTCPHGRPTLIEMNYRELEKKFGRAQ